MSQWVKNTIMLGVFAVWAVYMGVTVFINHEHPPDALWAVPTATYTILVGKAIPSRKGHHKDEK